MDQHPDRKIAPPLDPSLYDLSAESVAFFKSTTNIHDDDELKKHILNVQAQAYAVRGTLPLHTLLQLHETQDFQNAYLQACLETWSRTQRGFAPGYGMLLYVISSPTRTTVLHVDVPVGNDARKVALDGFPAEQIVTSDLRRELWDLGHVLFRSSPQSFPATFIAGDALDLAFLSPLKSGVGVPPEVNLASACTLNDLRGKVSVIWASAFFHLFSEKNQRQVAHALGHLLSPESGSIIFGSHIAMPNKGVFTDKISDKDVRMFCHDPDSWKATWLGRSTEQATTDNTGDFNGVVFHPDSVKFESMLVQVLNSEGGSKVWVLVWSITRL